MLGPRFRADGPAGLLKQLRQGRFGLIDAFVGEPLKFNRVTLCDRAGGEVNARELAAFVQQLVQSVDIVSLVGKVGEPVESGFVAGVGQLPEDAEVGLGHWMLRLRFVHRVSIAPSSYWKVKGLVKGTGMLTIGQLARYSGVPAKTIRYYHSIGLLPEPARDSSGYRRYRAGDAILLLRIRTLAEAGVPLARIASILDAGRPDLDALINDVDRQLTARIESLQRTRIRLRDLADPQRQLPPGVPEYLHLLAKIGMSPAWIDLERDLWILAFATHPESAPALLEDQHQAKTLPQVQQIYREYDQARDLNPDDPRLRQLADRMLAAASTRYAETPAPAAPPESPIPALIQDLVNSASPAWRRLDSYLRDALAEDPNSPARGTVGTTV